ncbi:uncharacterized protein C8orf34-like [Scleropages formosus]|uniref:uncharacterized protein C8orf34-like n=1 Tax=Scleropages formosus TaxID=113540 RepID=UPI0010FAA66A|nr:uncharacterized protein C8orf34-like [Scleropages formosus]
MMASREQSRIEAYLETNKIGPLFEEMMTRLISETPDQPVPFLITHLQGKKGSPVLLKNVLLGSAALWAQTPAHSKGVRWDLNGHEKSWKDHPRRPKKSKSDLEVCNLSPPSPESKSLPRSAEHPCWDSRTRPESNDFDELSHILQESKKLGKALESLSRSMAAVDEFYQEPISYNTPPPRPRVIGKWAGREDSDADPLAAEMLHPPLPREKSEDSSPSARLKVEAKRRGLKQQQQQHKKQLAALLSQENSSAGPDPSAAELNIEDEDDAMELMEDLEDLRMEGVTSLAPCRNKVIQVHGSHSSQPQAKLTLNICSRCARVHLSVASSLQQSETGVPSVRTSRKNHKVWGGMLQLVSPIMQAEFYQQLQAMRQPWLLPSDTDSENGVADGGPA